MNPNYLDFEQPIVELEEKIQELQALVDNSDIQLEKEIQQLHKRKQQLIDQVFSKLNNWQITQLSRHPLRPYTLDYVEAIFDDFQELRGDRYFSDDPAIVGGLAWLGEQSVVIIGHQKGRTVKEKVHRNFGMPKPEGYRKAKRLMELAERFSLPLITFIDTPGAYPGVDAEERGQSGAIANNLLTLSSLKTPVISVVIGEGGSGGALALGVCDHLMMLEFASYAVISPEGCASILWRSADKGPVAAEAMGVNASHLKKHGLIDEIVPEFSGGAHRNFNSIATSLSSRLSQQVQRFTAIEQQELLERRHRRLNGYGAFQVVEV